MRRIAIIPARSGSKRVPGKNIKEFCGKPIIAYSIEAALEAGIFDMVMVSTDGEHIADIAREYGAEVPFMRSAEAANDIAPDRVVQLEVLGEFKKRGLEFDEMIYIYPCAPFVTAERLKEAVKKYEETGATMVFPVVKLDTGFLRSYYIDDDGKLKEKFPEYYHYRTQDLPALYEDCGQFYVININEFMDPVKARQNWVPLVISEEEAQDIDTLKDWEIAEQKYKTLHNL